MARKQTAFSSFEQLVDMLDSAKSDAYRFYVHKNVSAGVRLRSKMSKIKKLAALIRRGSLKIEKEKLKDYEKTPGVYGNAGGWFGNGSKL